MQEYYKLKVVLMINISQRVPARRLGKQEAAERHQSLSVTDSGMIILKHLLGISLFRPFSDPDGVKAEPEPAFCLLLNKS